MMFNVRVKRFLNTEQIQVFSQPLLDSDSEREDRREVIRSTGEIVPLNRKKIYNPFSEEIEVGYYMGDEEENLKRSVRRTKNKIFDIAKSNKWEWFFTLTFNPEKVDSFDYEVTTQKLSKWLNNMHRKCPDMKYIVVPEQHESGRWHFHGLFANVENMVFVDSGKRDKKGRTIYNVGSYRLGFSTATKMESLDRAITYVSKYVTEDLCQMTKYHKRYWFSRNCDIPEVNDSFVLKSYEELKKMYGSRALYVKEVQSAYVDVTYIEIPIYTTNTDFSKRYRQKWSNKV